MLTMSKEYFCHGHLQWGQCAKEDDDDKSGCKAIYKKQLQLVFSILPGDGMQVHGAPVVGGV